uniref:Transposase n=1 Tax=Parastrongyloides trichosuri TaxID=131310 RepID=A0A0N4ZDA0_PARTI
MSPATLLLNTADRFNNELPIHNGYSGIHKLVKEVKREFNYRPLRQGVPLKIGDKVLRKVMHRKDATTSQKNQPTSEGPFTVEQHLYGDTYIIQRIGKKTRSGKEKVHADRLKIFQD